MKQCVWSVFLVQQTVAEIPMQKCQVEGRAVRRGVVSASELIDPLFLIFGVLIMTSMGLLEGV